MLENGNPQNIHWTNTAERELPQFGFICRQDAYDYCLEVLCYPGMLGENIPDMYDSRDQTLCETWAFLCPHPFKLPTPVYVKIGLHQNKLTLNLFSLHIDRKGHLKKAIGNYLKKHR